MGRAYIFPQTVPMIVINHKVTADALNAVIKW